MGARWVTLQYTHEVKKLTPRQRDVLEAIRRLQHRQGRSPTLDEVASAVGIRRAGAAEHIRNLETKGYLTRDRTHRSIELTDPRTGMSITRANARILPVIRAIHPGSTDSALMEVECHLAVPDHLIGGLDEAAFLLRVRDDAMANAGLLRDVMVVVRATPSAFDGQIVVALVETKNGVEGTVIARYRLSPSRGAELVSESSPEPRILRLRSYMVLGVVTGSMRWFEP
ncbi:MAG TPA: S24 family peptidase [Gaiellales bacterium]|nr:S24 family peptidase [Gaiellales bacterium]